MFTEKAMEDMIAGNPSQFLGESGLKLLGRQFRVGKFIFDLLFEDRSGGKLIVEIQKGTLDRSHMFKVLDYYHEYKEKHPREFVEVMVVANIIPAERKGRLAREGVSYREIPESEFLATYPATKLSALTEGTYQPTIKPSMISIDPNNFQKATGTKPVNPRFKLFMDQLSRFQEALKKYDPCVWFPPPRGCIEENKPGNWWIMFVPSSWGRWKDNFGVHFAFMYGPKCGSRPERIRLTIGVEKPLEGLFKQEFKERVISRVNEAGISQSCFMLKAKEQTKLLEVVDYVSFNDQSCQVAMERYIALQPVVKIIAMVLKEYQNREPLKHYWIPQVNI